MSNIYNLIQLEYEKKHLKHYNEQQDHISIAYEKIPELRDIDFSIKKLGVKCNLGILNNLDTIDSIDTFNNSITMLESKKRKLLLDNGFSADFLDMKYDCDKCKDTGILTNTFPSINCSCFNQQYVNCIFGQSNLSILKKENFSTFDESYYSDVVDIKKFNSNISPYKNILSNKNVVLNFINNFDNPNVKNLFFTGNTGVGKTFMLNCIAYELLKKEKTVIYKTSSLLFDIINKYKLQSAVNPNFDIDDYNQIFNVDLLIIDDLGAETKTDSKYSELLNILDIRQNNNKKTVISTNLGIEKIHLEYTERISSRIIENFELLRFFGDDIRLIKAHNGL